MNPPAVTSADLPEPIEEVEAVLVPLEDIPPPPRAITWEDIPTYWDRTGRAMLRAAEEPLYGPAKIQNSRTDPRGTRRPRGPAPVPLASGHGYG